MQNAANVQIGTHQLDNMALLAPMAGISDRPMRKLAESFGAGWVVSEMIASAALTTGQRDMVRKMAPGGRLPHVVQLAGCEPQWMTLGAQLAAEGGADVIDINFGCPAKRVTNGYAGSALMRVPDLALRLIEATAAAGLPVTVKMRLGWDDDTLNAPEFARLAADAGARMIVVHGRTRQQFYKDKARWNLVRNVVEAVDAPVIVNGDIINIETARAAIAQSGAAGVMIGRGAQGQPWIVGQIGAALAGRAGPTTPAGSELANLVAAHYCEILSEYGTKIGVRAARKHLGWYVEANLPGAPATARRALMTETDPDQVLTRIGELFSPQWERAA